MRYSGTNVPPANSPNEPSLNFFTRQSSSDYFLEWKYNCVIDNLEMLSKQLLPFYISGCDIVLDNATPTDYVYSVGSGLVFIYGLVYVPSQSFSLPISNTDIHVIRVTKDGAISTISLSSYNYDNDVINGLCKIGYVSNGSVIQSYKPNFYDFLQKLPIETAYYDWANYYNTNVRYG